MDHSAWLGFSLSNNNLQTSSTSDPESSHICLFEAFTTAATATTASGSNINLARGRGGEATGIASATDLSIFTGSPKLEDFLGGSCTATPPQPPQVQLGHHHLSSATTAHEIYDSELKTIAASFLRGFATEQTDSHHQQQQQQHLKHHHQQQQQLVPLVAQPAPKKTVDTFGQRTSIYRGVTRWTGRYEAHLWDNSCRREGQSRKGRQGGYDKEEKAARAYDLAALKYWGPTTTTNFPVSNYEKELEDMKNMTRQEFVASLRRKSSGFSRGASIYRGVTRHHQHGRWQARIGRVAGNKDLYLGTFSTQEEAAEAYDIAAIKFRGLNAVTNFDMSRYDVKSIANSNLPIGGITGKSKNSSESVSDCKSLDGGSRSDDRDISSASSHLAAFASSHPATSTLSFALPIKQDPSADYWSNLLGYQNNTTATPLTNAKSLSIAPTYLQSPTSSPSFNVDFAANPSSGVNESSNNGLFNVGNYLQQQQQQQQGGVSNSTTTTTTSAHTGSSNIPFATPIGLNSNSYESWISPSLHSFQTAKPSLSVFQTPIFGME
ncbi:AP2-like ethylene-responsive transcription factor AIL5 [Citrus sinensis]|uniref:AP2-like ethylene-responsive transcription factor AIL5 n=1 Tax=Citrus sinensis TaxID=2711 RepID=A0ACB8P6Z9_CITSI|nr:AP2-like ethylene-responsive transcription factor AIL5 [Citrus sinensis]